MAGSHVWCKDKHKYGASTLQKKSNAAAIYG